MKGIDVSKWNGQPFNAVTEAGFKASDFVIVKATEGTGYANPSFGYAMNRANKAGKLCLDWESGSNSAWGSTSWCLRFVEAYHKLSGVYPMIYIQASAVYQAASCAAKCALWVAGYPTNAASWAVPSFPYSVKPWKWFTIWQFSSGGGLDRNVTNIDKNQWRRLAGDSTVNKQKPGNAVNDAGLHYRSHVQKLGWLDAVRDGQQSGTTGNGYRMEGLKITPPAGWQLSCKAHISRIGWKKYNGIQKGESSGTGSSVNDPIIGTVGKGLGLEALEFTVTERPASAKGKKLWYRVHVEDFGWGGWTQEGFPVGSSGMSKHIECIQMKIE